MIRNLLDRFARNSSRFHLDALNRKFAANVPRNGTVLDAASGSQPYRSLFGHTNYESADFEMAEKAYEPSTYVCDLRSIPVEDARFDAILFNQGLEHMSEPIEVLKELSRVLKPGGKILITAPLFYEEHEQPYDFYRYTQFAYPHMLAKAELKIEDLLWVEGYLGTVAYQIETAAKYLPNGLILTPVRLLFAILAIVFYRSDIQAKHTTSGFPKNYAVIAVKQ
jgi:SAM-dependent methyltransferase